MIVTDDLFDAYAIKYKPMFISFIKKFFLDIHDFDDKMQICLIVLNNSMLNYDESRNIKFSTFLYNNLRNTFTDLLRKDERNKRPKIVSVDFDSHILLNAISEENENNDNMDILNDIVNNLFKIPRGEITYMIHVLGKTKREVAEIMGISEQRVGQLDKRIINRLKSIYKD